MKESEKIQQIVQKNKNKIQPSEFKATQITVFGSFHNKRKLVFSFLIHKNRVFPKNIFSIVFTTKRMFDFITIYYAICFCRFCCKNLDTSIYDLLF